MSTFPSTNPLQVARSQHGLFFLSRVLLQVIFAFPLGILSALASAIPVFASILPISFACALVCPIVVPLVVISGILLASWLIARTIFDSLVCRSKLAVTFARLLAADPRVALTLHTLFHAHEVTFMGFFGLFVILRDAMSSKESHAAAAKVPPVQSTCTRLFIHDLPGPAMPAFPLTPPFSSPSYTPTRSPTSTESTAVSTPLLTPAEESTHMSLASQLSDVLNQLKDDELDLVASYIEILKRGKLKQVLG